MAQPPVRLFLFDGTCGAFTQAPRVLKSVKNKKPMLFTSRAWVSASKEVSDYIAFPMPRVSDPIPGLEDWGYRLPNVSGVAARHWASRKLLLVIDLSMEINSLKLKLMLRCEYTMRIHNR